ncbi:MAG TPA: outer membrane beta-barrel protein [Candidatus Angelobacter sp.]|nr:outer membrane beta-barrel protein [Candidatus Angelobacter sp.]
MRVRLIEGICVCFFALIAGVSANADDFKGFYVGANAGGAFGSANAQTTTVFSPTGYFATTSPGAIAIAGNQNLSPKGGTFGGQAGLNLQFHRLVAGFELDFGGMKLSQSQSTSGTYPCCAPTGFTVNQSVNTDWLFTLRPRVGFTAGHWLVYGTAGLAVTNLTYKAQFTDTFATANESGQANLTQTGWTAGGGVEYHLKSSHWSVKGEYLFANFGSVTTTSTNLTAFTPPIAFPQNPFTHTTNLHANVARAGFNYRF